MLVLARSSAISNHLLLHSTSALVWFLELQLKTMLLGQLQSSLYSLPAFRRQLSLATWITVLWTLTSTWINEQWNVLWKKSLMKLLEMLSLGCSDVVFDFWTDLSIVLWWTTAYYFISNTADSFRGAIIYRSNNKHDLSSSIKLGKVMVRHMDTQYSLQQCTLAEGTAMTRKSVALCENDTSEKKILVSAVLGT